MASLFPACSAPVQIQITQPSSTTIRAKWYGNATTFKIRYKLEANTAWTEDDMAGGGSEGGSGNFTGNNPAQTNPPLFDIVQADFTTGTLTPGLWDLELINICLDGSEYKFRTKVLIKDACGTIPNIRLVHKTESEIRVEWDAYVPEGAETVPDAYLVTWCELDQFGNVIDCDSAETEDLFYVLTNPPGTRYQFNVQKQCGDFGNAQSEYLNLYVCKCGGGGDLTTIVTGAALTFTQAAAASIWGPINHALGFLPNVTTVDNAGQEMRGVVQYIDADHLQIVFSKAVSGYAYLS